MNATWLGASVLSAHVGDAFLGRALADFGIQASVGQGLSRSNRGHAWHSNFFETEVEIHSIRRLKVMLEEPLRTFIDGRAAEPLREYRLHFTSLWANVLTGDGSNVPHRHAEVGAEGEDVPIVSGVYYASLPSRKESCARLRIWSNTSLLIEKPFVVDPQIGKVILFPADAMHDVKGEPEGATEVDSVEETSASAQDEKRVSWAFNVAARPVLSGLDSLAALGNESAIQKHLKAGGSSVQKFPSFTAMHHASEVGHASVVSMLVSHNVSSRELTPGGKESIHLAIAAGHAAVVSALVQSDQTVALAPETQSKMTPLHLASSGGHAEIAKMLIASVVGSGIPTVSIVRAKRSDGAEPIHDSVRNGHLDMVRFLIQRGADANAADGAGQRPIHEAIRGGLLDVADVLVVAGAETDVLDGEGRALDYWAARGGHVGALEWLVRTTVAAPARKEYVRAKADSKAGAMVDYMAAAMLLQGGGEPQIIPAELTPVHAAAFDGHTAVLEWLHKNGHSLDATSAETRTQPIHLAAGQGHVAIIDILLRAGVDVGSCSRGRLSPLHWASAAGEVPALERLLAAGASPRNKSTDGSEALHFAAARGFTVAAEMLLHRGASAGAANRRGDDALGVAVAGGHAAVSELLQTWRKKTSGRESEL